MFPLAELSLFVKDEMAQPIHWLLGCGDPIRGVGPAD